MAPNARSISEFHSALGSESIAFTHKPESNQTMSSSTDEQGKVLDELLWIRDKLCCGDSTLTDKNAMKAPKLIPMKDDEENSYCTTVSRPKFIEAVTQKILDVYHNGVITQAKFQRKDHQQSMTYISEEEEYFAKRWNGHQPLTAVPIQDVIAAPQNTRIHFEGEGGD
jgi:hypothetical protein